MSKQARGLKRNNYTATNLLGPTLSELKARDRKLGTWSKIVQSTFNDKTEFCQNISHSVRFTRDVLPLPAVIRLIAWIE